MHRHSITFLLFLSCAATAQQQPHPTYRNYGTADGLPSPEVHYCLEDQQGYLWFATDNGLSRFDGYSFKNYGPKQGLKDPVVFYLQLDARGRVWAGTLSSRLYIVEGDSVVPYHKNGLIDSLAREPGYLSDFVLLNNGDIYLSIGSNSILHLPLIGEPFFFKSKNRFGGSVMLKTPAGWIHGLTAYPKELEQEYRHRFMTQGLDTPPEVIDGRQRAIRGEIMHRTNAQGSWTQELSGGSLLFFSEPYLYQIAGDSVKYLIKATFKAQKKSFIQQADGSLLAGAIRSGGLRRYAGLDALWQDNYEQWLPGKSVTQVFTDQRGGLWVGTIEHGVFHFPNPALQVYDSGAGLLTDYVAAIATGAPGELFIGNRGLSVQRLDLRSGTLTALPAITNFVDFIQDLIYDETTNTLWAGSGMIAFFKDNQWTYRYKLYLKDNYALKKQVLGRNLSLRPGSQQLWGSNTYGFGMMDLRMDSITVDGHGLGVIQRTFAVQESSDGRIWVARADGLFEFKDQQLRRPNPFFPLLETRVDDLAELPDGTLALATRGEGLLLWRDSSLLQIGTEDGLISDMPENLHVDAQGRIWAGSMAGLSRVTFKGSTMPLIENFTTWHGLPSSEITMVRSRGDEVWVATAAGLLRWVDPPKNTSTTPPLLQTVTVNGWVKPGFGDLPLSHDENNLSFKFLTINHLQAGRILYRFRLEGGEWNYTQERSANFASLSPGSYIFEVQSQNEDGVWSETLRQSFIVRPPWWRSHWFYGLAAMAVASSAFAFYRYRTGLLKKELAVQQQMTELERKALQAQMNPHFIFNCLNSIQRLILEKDEKGAVNYLTRFAKLVRSTLNASAAGKVSLQEEIDLLDNYLRLEKLRFKEAFDYKISADPSLDCDGLVFPPMLLQPYVENAVKHGMAGKERGGKISICLAPLPGKQKGILATITDNGPGLSTRSDSVNDHKSLGMSLTMRRLELLSKEGLKEDAVNVEYLMDNNRVCIGTRVVVKIAALR